MGYRGTAVFNCILMSPARLFGVPGSLHGGSSGAFRVLSSRNLALASGTGSQGLKCSSLQQPNS